MTRWYKTTKGLFYVKLLIFQFVFFSLNTNVAVFVFFKNCELLWPTQIELSPALSFLAAFSCLGILPQNELVWEDSQIPLNTEHCSLYTVHCTLYNLHSTLYTRHCTQYTVNNAQYTGHCMMCSLYNEQLSL